MRHKCTFDLNGNELTPSARYDFKFKDYSPWVFRHLRELFRLDPADYLVSLTGKYILSELGSPGKSGSFFYFSRDYRFIIKTIHHAEHKFLRKILKEYYQHVRTNPNTLISQFYGLHRVKTRFGGKIHFVVMNNLFPPHKDIHATYDLKGSTIGRDLKDEKLRENPRSTLKDLNWLRRDMHLFLGPRKREVFLSQIKSDVALLASLHIMDYSLLLGIHELAQIPVANQISEGEMAPLQRSPSVSGQNYRHRDLRRMVTSHTNSITLSQIASANSISISEKVDMDMQLRPGTGMKHNIFYQEEGGMRASDLQDKPGDFIYYFGVIDLLTRYNTKKRFEHFFKGFQYPKSQISAVPPEAYAERFSSFVSAMTKTREELARVALRSTPSVEVLDAAKHQMEKEDPDPSDALTSPVLSAVRVPDPHSGVMNAPTTTNTGSGLGGDVILPVVEEGDGSDAGDSGQGSSGCSEVPAGRAEQQPTLKALSGSAVPEPGRNKIFLEPEAGKKEIDLSRRFCDEGFQEDTSILAPPLARAS